MTIIATKIHKDRIEIAADSQTGEGNNKYAGEVKESMFMGDLKIKEVNDIVFGSSGEVAEATLFEYFCVTNKPKSERRNDIFEFIIKFMEWKEQKTHKYNLKNRFIIIYKHKVFQVVNTLIREVKDYCAIGSGTYIALGVLYMSGTVEEAVEAAKEFDLLCGGKTQKLIIKRG